MQTPPDLRAFRPESETYEEYRERYYDSIPYKFQHLICECTHAEMKTWINSQPKGTLWITHENGVIKCNRCSKYTTLWTYLEYCYSCDEMYVTKVCPDRMLLCEDCGG